MKSQTTPDFWEIYRQLPPETRKRAQSAYRLWRDNPRHNSLQCKKISRSQPIYSVRVGLDHRAPGRLEDDTVHWYWIGAHDEYDRLLGS